MHPGQLEKRVETGHSPLGQRGGQLTCDDMYMPMHSSRGNAHTACKAYDTWGRLPDTPQHNVSTMCLFAPETRPLNGAHLGRRKDKPFVVPECLGPSQVPRLWKSQLNKSHAAERLETVGMRGMPFFGGGG